jgi:PAS domain S-box-containing protein
MQEKREKIRRTDDHSLLIFEERNRAFRILYDTAVEVEGASDEDILSILCRNLLMICGGQVAAIATFNSEQQTMFLDYVCQREENGNISVLELPGEEIKVSSSVIRSFQEKQVQHCEAHRKCLVEIFAGSVLDRLHLREGKNCYRLSCVREGELIAAGLVQLAPGQKLKMKDMVDTYLSLAGMIIQRIYMIRSLRKSEENYRTMFERWRTTFNGIRDAVCLLDGDVRIIQCNRAMEKLAGNSQKELVGRICCEVIHGNSQPLAECPLVKMRGSKQREILAVKIDDQWLEVIVDPLFDEEGTLEGAVHIVSDITERKRAEEALLNTQKLESLGILAGGIAHDFNNLLMSIMGNISFAKLKEIDVMEIDRILTEAEFSCMQAKNLTQQLLTFSMGGKPLKKTVNFADILQESALFALSGSGSKVVFSIVDDLWPLDVDTGQLYQVVNNLVINADQAMFDGGIIEISAENIVLDGKTDLSLEEGKYVLLTFKDIGVGIPEEYLDKIFDPYFTTKKQGSGLGLATVYSIIKNHNGQITVESETGSGTSFSIYLPASDRQALREESQENKIVRGEGRILIMDDDDRIQMILARILRYLGYEVEGASNGIEAIEKYRKAREEKNPFNAVILDLTVPGSMGGRETIQELLKLDPDVRAIVSSGYSTDAVMADYRKYGFSGIIAKPYKLEELSEVIYRVISETGASDKA